MKEGSQKEDQTKNGTKNEIHNNNILNINNNIDLDHINQMEDNKKEILLRDSMLEFEKNPEYNEKLIKVLFSLVDLNYINSEYYDSNIFMKCCQKSEPKLINLLLDGINFAKKRKSNEIDFFKVDKENKNILHYLLSNNNDNINDISIDKDEIFEKIMIYAIKNIKNKNKIDLLTKEDINGITPLVIILKNGWYNVLQVYFKYFKYKPHIIKSNKNNYIHCAIDGKNIKCLKLILNYCSYEELNQTNSAGLNPCLYAKEKKYYYMSELIKQVQNNYNNEDIRKVFLLNKNDTNTLINLFMDNKFVETQKYLSKYKIVQNINDKYTNISFEWNSLLTKRYDIFNKGLKPEHILTKFTKNSKNSNNSPYQNKPNIIATLLEFNKFFNKYLNETAIKNHLNEESYSIDIVIYNKIIYYYKISDYSSFLKYINLYFTHIYHQVENNFINKNKLLEKNNENESENDINYNKIRVNYHKYIAFVNISFLLVEYFIKENNEQFSQIIMDELNKYFTDNSPSQINKKKNIENDNSKNINKIILNLENKKTIIEYLNNNEVLNPLNSSLDDSTCYLYLLEVFFILKFNSSKSEAIRTLNKLSNIKYISDKSEDENEEKDEEDEEEEAEIEDNNNIYDDINIDNNKNNIKILNNSKNILKKVKIIMKNSVLLKNLTKRFKMFYYELKSYLYYLSGDTNKSMSKNFKIKDIITLNTKSNEYISNEHKLFYYNSQGIINLKLKKYSVAAYFFKLGIYLFKSMQNDNNTYNLIEHNDIIINKSEYLFKMKFNLGLAYFFNNNYIEAYHIFNELKDIQIIKNNIFFWFRFGLCSLNLYLYSVRKIKQKLKKFYKNLNKNKEMEENTDSNVYSEEIENNSVDELYEEYEKIYASHNNLDIYLENKDDKFNKIFIENNSRKILDNDYDKNIDKYLEMSIISFKKVLNIYKKVYNNYLFENKKIEDLKGIYNFYTKNIGESKEFKNMINKQNINKKNNIPKSLIYSCYLNLLFSYNLKKKYMDMLLLIKNIKKEKIMSNSIKRKIRYYELLSLINLNKNKMAEELINEEKNKYGNIDKDTNNDFDCFNIDDYQIEKDINHKILLDIGQVFIYCKNKKFEEAEKKLLNIIENNYNGNEDISRYYYQLMVYILSSLNKKSKTINFIKFRWKQIQNNNITHTNYYKDNNG